jgi:hypothetical protein
MRNKFYFPTNVPPYRAGEWYDNIPDSDVSRAKDIGALELHEADCGCCLTEDNKAVRVGMKRGGQYCSIHLETAIRKPDSGLRKRS